MFDSIIDDIKHQLRSGNMVTKLIIINLMVFVVTFLIKNLLPFFYEDYIIPYISMPGNIKEFLFKPWTIFTYMFVHAGLYHIIMNMLVLYWFGRITGDRIGDRHILPIYIFGGLMGGLAYLLSYTFVFGSVGSTMVGASASILAIAMVAGRINPDYEMRMILFGNVKIKYIILAVIIVDLMMISKNSNTGGHIAHLGGMFLGWVFYNQVGRQGDLTSKFDIFWNSISSIFSGDRRPKKKKSPLKVKFKSDKIKTMSERRADNKLDIQAQVDQILDKINQKGYDSLSDEEKDILYKASKK